MLNLQHLCVLLGRFASPESKKLDRNGFVCGTVLCICLVCGTCRVFILLRTPCRMKPCWFQETVSAYVQFWGKRSSFLFASETDRNIVKVVLTSLPKCVRRPSAPNFFCGIVYQK